jgi:hypothetical protein
MSAESAKLGALERLEKLERDFEALAKSSVVVAQSGELTAQRQLGTEQSCLSLGKMLSAIAKNLKDRKLIDDEQIMTSMREADDQAAKDRVKEMVEGGYIAPVDTVNEISLVIVTHDLMNLATSELKRVSSFRVVEMPSPSTPESVKRELLGRKPEDKYETSVEDKNFVAIITVKAIYNIVEVDKKGEATPPQG